MKGSLCRLAETSFLWRDTAMRIRERFNPRAPCGARQAVAGSSLHIGLISTHAPLAGRDQVTVVTKTRTTNFNPRAPCGARHSAKSQIDQERDFNPRAPCGARQQKCTNHYAHFCDNRQISDAFAQNAACQSILLLFDAGKPCGFGCEPPKWSLRACASHYKIIGSSGRYVCLQPKCSILFSYFLPK